MKTRWLIITLTIPLLVSLTGCTISLLGTPTPLPTIAFPTFPPILLTPQPSPTLSVPMVAANPTATWTPVPLLPTITPAPSTPAVAILPGAPSGPYGVIWIKVDDTLSIRSAPGASSPKVGTFAATATNVMRSGPSAWVGSDLWAEVQNPAGGKGWVNLYYLTEYVTPTAFCADAKVNTLIANLDTAITNANGDLLKTLVSPAHGLDLYLWRHGNIANYTPAEASWVFNSTYEINWGAAPASGMETKGTFDSEVKPKLLDVLNASYELHCNTPGAAAAFSTEPWPNTYANINYYNIFKPGTPGVELDWRVWLAGVEYVNGKPYLFALIHFQWEP